MTNLPKGLSLTPFSSKGVNTTIARLYDTNIVTMESVNASTLITLNSGGWNSRHTKKCTNLVFSIYNLPYHLYQQDFTWYVMNTTTNKITKYSDNMELYRK